MKFLSLLVGLLCCTMRLALAQGPWQADPVLSRYMLYQLVQDKAGFLWASTAEGIFRYDGYQTVPLNKLIRGQPPLPTTPYALIPGRRDELWLQGVGGLFRYSCARQQLQSFAVARSKTDDPGQGLLVLDTLRNTYWLQRSAHSITAMRLRQAQLVPGRTYQFPSRVVWAAVAANGDLWVATYDRTLTRIVTTGQQRHYFPPANRRIYPLLDTAPAQFFSACAQYTARPDGSLHEVRRWLPAQLNGFTEETAFWPYLAPGAERWIVGNHLVQLRRAADGATVTGAAAMPLHFANGDGYENAVAYQLFTDALGMEWAFSGEVRGCYKRYQQAGVQSLPSASNYLFSARAMARLPDGRLLASTYSNVLLQPAGQPGAALAPWPVPYTGRENLLVAYDLFILSGRRLLVASEDNLYLMHTDSWQKTPLSLDSRHTIRPNAIARDAAGRVWVGAETGLYWLDTARLQLHRYQGGRTGSVPRGIKALAVVPGGHLWLATTSGLCRLETATGRVRRFAHALPRPQQLPTDQLLSLHPAGSRVWVGTLDQGLLLVDPGRGVVRQLTTSNGLPSNTVCSLLPDEQHNLWLGTFAGVVRYRPATGATAVFTTSDGLAADECNYGSAFRDAGGALYFGGVKGLTRFLPRQLAARYSPHRRLNISRVTYRVGGDTLVRTLYPGPHAPYQLSLHDEDQAQVQVVLADYLSPANTDYWYQLRGANSATWRKLPASRTLSLQYLPAGNYTIAFRAQSANGVDAANTLAIPLQVQRSWWKQPWWQVAIAVAVAAAMGTILLVNRRRQQQRLHRLRGRLADDLHDELGALLVRASFQAEALKYEPTVQLTTINQLLINLQGASQTMRDIAWGIDPNANTFGNLCDRMQEYLDQLPATGQCCTRNFHSGIPNEKSLGAAVRQHIYSVFKEAVTNAIRHANGCETLHVSLQQESGQLVLQVVNDGAPVAVIRRSGMGLRSMGRRAQEAGGQLEAAPNAEGGFRVVLTVPLR